MDKNKIIIVTIIGLLTNTETRAIFRDNETIPNLNASTVIVREEQKKIRPEQDRRFMKHSVDYAFILKVEGYRRELYVPNNKGIVIGKSGATVGVGVDIGQHNENEFISAGIPKSIRDKIRPFFGIKGQMALELVNRNPVTLTDEEAKLLSKLIIDKKIKQVQEAFDKESKTKFFDIPANVQTVLVSISYQYGSLKYTKNRNANRLWQLAIEGDWEGFERLLRDFGDKYVIRRRREADLLKITN